MYIVAFMYISSDLFSRSTVNLFGTKSLRANSDVPCRYGVAFVHVSFFAPNGANVY